MRFEAGLSTSNFVVSKLFRTMVGVDLVFSETGSAVTACMNFVAENAGCFWLLLASATTADSERYLSLRRALVTAAISSFEFKLTAVACSVRAATASVCAKQGIAAMKSAMTANESCEIVFCADMVFSSFVLVIADGMESTKLNSA
jgi:hypothetical protein